MSLTGRFRQFATSVSGHSRGLIVEGGGQRQQHLQDRSAVRHVAGHLNGRDAVARVSSAVVVERPDTLLNRYSQRRHKRLGDGPVAVTRRRAGERPVYTWPTRNGDMATQAMFTYSTGNRATNAVTALVNASPPNDVNASRSPSTASP
jgi:hypothetical protein